MGVESKFDRFFDEATDCCETDTKGAHAGRITRDSRSDLDPFPATCG